MNSQTNFATCFRTMLPLDLLQICNVPQFVIVLPTYVGKLHLFVSTEWELVMYGKLGIL